MQCFYKPIKPRASIQSLFSLSRSKLSSISSMLLAALSGETFRHKYLCRPPNRTCHCVAPRASISTFPGADGV